MYTTLFTQFPPQPCLGQSQIATNPVDRHLQSLGNLLGSHASEVAHFDQRGQGFVLCRQGLYRVVQFNEFH